MNFFKTKQRTPPDVVKSLRDSIGKLDAGPPGGDTRRKVSCGAPLPIERDKPAFEQATKDAH